MGILRRRYCKYDNCTAEAMHEDADVYLCIRHTALVVDQLQEGFAEISRPQSPLETRERAERARKAKEAFMKNAVVYYVRLGGRIKIGTTISMVERMRELHLNALDGEVLATEPGSYELEKQRHQQFAEHRLRRSEFFQPHPDLMDHIAAVRDEHGDPNMTYRIRGKAWA